MRAALTPGDLRQGGQRENVSRIARGGVARRIDLHSGDGRTTRRWFGPARKGRLRAGALRRASRGRRAVPVRPGDEPRSVRPLRGACAEAPGRGRARSTPLQGERRALRGAIGVRPARRGGVQRPGERLQYDVGDVRRRCHGRLRGRWRLWRALPNCALGRGVPGGGWSGPDEQDLLRRLRIAERRLRRRDALAAPSSPSDRVSRLAVAGNSRAAAAPLLP
jgi:hypothetical protein